MTVSEKQRRLVADFLVIENRRERLAAVLERARGVPSLLAEERVERNRVAVCQSPVWVAGGFVDGGLSLRFDADSSLVRGLVGLMCEVYQGGSAEEVLAVEPTVFDELGIAPELSPTRKNGLAGVRERIRGLAGAELKRGAAA
jgi:cysteine desulfuration protein SufE